MVRKEQLSERENDRSENVRIELLIINPYLTYEFDFDSNEPKYIYFKYYILNLKKIFFAVFKGY